MKKLLLSCVLVCVFLFAQSPSATAQDCGDVPPEGCCQGNTARLCLVTVPFDLDCGLMGGVCGWSEDMGTYWCGEDGAEGPSEFPKACGSTSPVETCGDGWCTDLETVDNCPDDCKTGSDCTCLGKECGNDGCGYSCGACEGTGAYCDLNGKCQSKDGCIPACTGKTCGPDGCDSTCGTCPTSMFCNVAGQCETGSTCTPDCKARQCGNDGCGGSCGTCYSGLTCNAAGACVNSDECIPDCGTAECGGDGCGGSCGECSVGQNCSNDGLCVATVEQCPEGQTMMYGKCVNIESDDSRSGGGCSSGTPTHLPSGPLVLLLTATIGLSALRRRARQMD